MNKVGKFCETINHHPNWYNAYNVVKIELTTHDLGGLSNLDFKLEKKLIRFIIALVNKSSMM